MKNIVIKVASDFTDTPGGRYIKEGPYSGEEFRKNILIKKYYEAKADKCKIMVDIDGCYGLATSFLEEAFGGLVREVKSRDIKDLLIIKSDDRPNLVEKIIGYINEAKIDG